MKVLFVFAMMLVLATASDLSRYGGQQEDEDNDPEPYQFSYAVDDEYTVFSQSEEGDEEGDVAGEYSVNLPDGRVQTVKYYGDNDDGYTAEVIYESEAQYPEDQSYQADDHEEEEEEEGEEEEDEDEEELIPIYAYRPVYN